MHERHRPHRRSEGTAMVEAVIMLPVLAMLFLGVGLVRSRALAREQALLEARRCAWDYALAGCDPQHVPASCKQAPAEGQSAEGRARADDLLGRVDQSHNRFNPFDDVPVIGGALRALFGTTTTASAQLEVQSPWTVGLKFSEGGALTVACNEHPHNVLDVATGILTQHLPAAVKP
ncbi:MAG: TadE/TadG family type IV pilus assembly protein [Polyangiales bacterium]